MKTFNELREMNGQVNEAMKMKDIARKHKRELQNAVKKGSLELSKKAEEDLMQWAMDNGEVNTDDPDDFIEWLDNNLDDIVKGKIKENVEEGKEEYIMKKGTFTRKVDGKTADKMKRQGWKLVAKEDVDR